MTGEWCRRWTDWFDFLGTDRPADKMSYAEAQKCVQDAGIRSGPDYQQGGYRKMNEKLKKDGKLELPRNPDRVYNGSG